MRVDNFNGESFRMLRAARRATLDHIAKATGKTRSTILRWEKGESRPTDDDVRAIARRLGCTKKMLTTKVNVRSAT